MVQELTALKNRLTHVQALTTAISERFSQLVANHRRFLVLTQVCGGGGGQDATPLRDRLEDLVDNKVDAEKAVSYKYYFFISIHPYINIIGSHPSSLPTQTP